MVAVSIVSACDGERQTTPTARRTVRLMASPEGTGALAVLESIARELTRRVPGVNVVMAPSSGSVANLTAVHEGRTELALTFADVAYLGFSGRLQDRVVHDRLRALTVLKVGAMTLVARPGASIATPADLRGHRVGIGPPGSSTSVAARMLLDAFGLNDSVQTAPLDFREASQALREGALDAMFGYTIVPSDSVRVAMEGGAALVPIEGPHIEALRQRYPFLKVTAIPEETYPGMTRAIHTLGVDALLVCHSDLDEGLVHDLTKALVELLRPRSGRGFLPGADLEHLPATTIPLHHGAARYHRERKLLL